MTAYNLHISGVKPCLAITRSPDALEAKERRKAQLEEIRRRRREQYKQFLVSPRELQNLTSEQ